MTKIITITHPECGHTYQYDLFQIGRNQISIHKSLDRPIKVPVNLKCPNCHKHFIIHVPKSDLPPNIT